MKVTLNDGTEYDVLSCSNYGDKLFIVLNGFMDVKDAANIFSDTENTDSITAFGGFGGDKTYNGFTHLFGVMTEDYTGHTQIYLARESE